MDSAFYRSKILFVVSAILVVCFNDSVLASGQSPSPKIHGFVSRGEVQQLRTALEAGADLSSLDDMERTALMLAAQEGRTEILLLLVLQRADVNFKNSDGKTAVMFACESNQFDSVAILVQAGADLNAVDKTGKSVLKYTEQPGYERLNAFLREQGAHVLKQSKTRGVRGKSDETETYYSVHVHYATNRKQQMKDKPPLRGFSNIPDSVLHYGTCKVSIPKLHRRGDLESPNPFLLQFSEDPSKHVVLMSVTELDAAAYFDVIKNRLKNSEEQDVLLFIHGFNVGFSEAARRTAQMSYDLNFKGVPLFFSWPSNESILSYKNDKERILNTIPILKDYLAKISSEFKGARINIIAHSMGTFGFTRALSEMVSEVQAKNQSLKFNQIILAAPDINAKIFRDEIAPKISQVTNKVTLYASSHDVALMISKLVNQDGSSRAGDSSPEIMIANGVDSIDVSSLDSSLLGHSYYGESVSVISDIKSVIHEVVPEKRSFLEPREALSDKKKFWFFNPLSQKSKVTD